MGYIHLVTGGSRSGKSDHARRLAEDLPGPRTFIATCPVTDEEMERRVERHRRERAGAGWVTAEEEVQVVHALREAGSSGVVLIDCLTLWVNNLMYEAERAGKVFGEDEVSARANDLITACRAASATVILVTNEIGMGIVPDNALARRYRDLVGRCNQVVAAAADRVTLVVSGIPVEIRKKGDT
jgi:adenosylcobinamide kinase/adenosylcobinamide-phosphate guanylyltransferase